MLNWKKDICEVSIDEDGTYSVNAIFYSTPGELKGHGDKEAVLVGGNKEIVHVKPSS